MKCSLNCLILSYLLCNLWLQAVGAVPEVAPLASSLKPRPIPDSDTSDDTIELSLEKRSASRQYNFGIGKKSDTMADTSEGESEDPEYNYEDIDKRGDHQNRFAFGLGKRAKGGEQRFAFGLGKRRPNDNRFQFGLGKRGLQRDNRFAFGLGKREHNFEDYIKRRYSFGLGKRSQIPESFQ